MVRKASCAIGFCRLSDFLRKTHKNGVRPAAILFLKAIDADRTLSKRWVPDYHRWYCDIIADHCYNVMRRPTCLDTNHDRKSMINLLLQGRKSNRPLFGPKMELKLRVFQRRFGKACLDLISDRATKFVTIQTVCVRCFCEPRLVVEASRPTGPSPFLPVNEVALRKGWNPQVRRASYSVFHDKRMYACRSRGPTPGILCLELPLEAFQPDADSVGYSE